MIGSGYLLQSFDSLGNGEFMATYIKGNSRITLIDMKGYYINIRSMIIVGDRIIEDENPISEPIMFELVRRFKKLCSDADYDFDDHIQTPIARTQEELQKIKSVIKEKAMEMLRIE